MKKIVFGIVLCAAAVASAYIGPEQITASPDGKALYVTGASGACALVVDATTGAVLSRMELDGCQPTGVAVNRSNGDIYITASDATGNGQIFRFQRDGKRAAVVKQGHQPMAPLVSADGKRLWVANRFDNSVVALDAATLAVQESYRVSREPVGLALGAGGKFLFAANHLPDCPATNAVVAAAVSVIDLSSKAVRTVLLPNGSTGVRGIASTPNGKSVFVTHTFGRYQLPTTQLERGWMNTAGLSVLDGETGNYVNTVLLDDVDLGAANPWGVTVSADEKLLAVNHAGTREVSVIELPALLERLAKAQRNERVTEVTHAATDVPNDLSFLVNIRRRYRLSGDGPRGIAMVGNSVYSAVYFADCISRLDLNEGIPQAKEFLLGPKVDLSKDRVRRGEMLWNDGAMCFQQWQSCASCHPDGRSDSLNWDLLNDGIGNPKQSKSLIYCQFTPPTMVTGIRPTMQACNRAGYIHIQFVMRPEEDGRCLDAYVESLRPVPSPFLVDGKLSAAAERGRAIFNGKAGCAMCHSPDAKGPKGEMLFTDKQLHDTGLGVGNEKGRRFDTTGLAECWRTAPYLYDGRSRTIEEMLTRDNPQDTHGMTQKLTPEEIKDLAEYVKSL